MMKDSEILDFIDRLKPELLIAFRALFGGEIFHAFDFDTRMHGVRQYNSHSILIGPTVFIDYFMAQYVNTTRMKPREE